MLVKHVTSAGEFRQAIDSAGEKVVVVDFYADWCGPCTQIRPHFERLSQTHANSADFLKVNIDELEDIAMEHDVQALPTFIFWKSGAEVNRYMGTDGAELERRVVQLISTSTTTPKKHVKIEEDKDKGQSSSGFAPLNLLSNILPSGLTVGMERSFQGHGHRLGSAKEDEKPAVDKAEAEFAAKQGWLSAFTGWLPGSAESSQSEKEMQAQEKMNVDVNQPQTMVHIRLSDASKMSVKLNLAHPVSKLREFLVHVRPEFANKPFALLAPFPRGTTLDESSSIEEAQLQNSLVTQKMINH